MSTWLVFLTFLLQAGYVQPPVVSVEDNDVYLRIGFDYRQLTHDGAPKRLPVLSPDGKRILYVLDLPPADARENQDGGAAEAIVEIDLEGKQLQRIVPPGFLPRPFDRLDWIDDRRVGAMSCGHANCWYWILDAQTAATLKVMEGGFDFIWSHDGQWVARREVAEFGGHDGVPYDEFDTLLLNETEVYPPADGEDMVAFRKPPLHLPPHGHVFSPFAWSPDDQWVGFAEAETPQGDVFVVLASPRGEIIRQKVANPVAPIVDGTVIEWVDQSHVKLTTPGQTLNFALDGNELRFVPLSP